VAFVTQSSKSSYKAVIVSPERAFDIMVELKDPLSIAKILSAYDFNRIRDCHSQAKRDSTRA